MGEGFFGWKKKQSEQREFINPETHEPAEKIVTDDAGNVIGHAGTEAQARRIAADAREDFKEAA
ncbi:MAG: hypothetical protein AAB892_01320 [Patescibacteria group bacterium]